MQDPIVLHRFVRVAIAAAALALGAACSAPASAPVEERLGAASAASSTAFPNDKTAYDYFRGQGFTSFQAAAIVGNLDQESGIDPTISQNGGGPGRGIAQWSAGGRWDTDQGDNLVAFAQQEGKNPMSLDVQLDFIMFELNTFAGYGLAKLKASTNVADATQDFELDFEGCAIASECALDSRVGYANDVLAAYGNDPVPDAGSPADDASTPSEGGSDPDAGQPPPASDGGSGPSAHDAGANPAIDSGSTSPPGSGSSSGSASSGSPSFSAPSTSSGCAVGAAGGAGGASYAWLVVTGLVLGLGRRRCAARGSSRRATPRAARSRGRRWFRPTA
jgi:hypothetical protein